MLLDHLLQKFKETEDSRYIYRNELDKVCFQHNMADEDFKDLSRRTASDKVFRDKAFNIAKNSKYDGCQKGLASMVYNFFFFFFLIKSLLKVVALIMKLNKMRN